MLTFSALTSVNAAFLSLEMLAGVQSIGKVHPTKSANREFDKGRWDIYLPQLARRHESWYCIFCSTRVSMESTVRRPPALRSLVFEMRRTSLCVLALAGMPLFEFTSTMVKSLRLDCGALVSAAWRPD
jgi:hypothetical protein